MVSKNSETYSSNLRFDGNTSLREKVDSAIEEVQVLKLMKLGNFLGNGRKYHAHVMF